MFLIKISDDNGELCFSTPNERSVFAAMEMHARNPQDSLLEVVLPPEKGSRIVAMVLPSGDFWHSCQENPINAAAFLRYALDL